MSTFNILVFLLCLFGLLCLRIICFMFVALLCLLFSCMSYTCFVCVVSTWLGRCLYCLHPVSITRFPLRRFSPGAGLLRNPFVHRKWLRFSRCWVRTDGNLLTEIGCTYRPLISDILQSTFQKYTYNNLHSNLTFQTLYNLHFRHQFRQFNDN